MRGGFLAGLLCGAMLFGGGTVLAAEASVSGDPIYVDGRKVELEAYRIAGNNYVKLRDIGAAVGFNVYWDAGVQVDSGADYTGVPPEAADGVQALRQAMVADINALRQTAGLSVLPADALAMEAAQVRAEEMAAAGVYSHTRPGGAAYLTVTDCPTLAENLHCLSGRTLAYRGQSAAEAAVADWSGSDAHRANLLSTRATAVGVGLARGTNDAGEACWYCAALFVLDGGIITWVDAPAA